MIDRSKISPELLKFFDALKLDLEKESIFISIFSGHRSPEEQDILFAKGRTTPGPIVTNLKGGQSRHNKLPSEAIDIVQMVNNKPIWTGFIPSPGFKSKMDTFLLNYPNIEWGGYWTKPFDPYHFQVKKK